MCKWYQILVDDEKLKVAQLLNGALQRPLPPPALGEESLEYFTKHGRWSRVFLKFRSEGRIDLKRPLAVWGMEIFGRKVFHSAWEVSHG